MIYKDFQGLKLPALGLGAMRLPILAGNYQQIDETETAKMIAYAMEHGVNYFDTAWGYHEGNSERVFGKLLSKYPREHYYLASKFPGYDLANMDKAESIFAQQLEKCQVDYFDFYMLHNVCEMNIDAYLDQKYGIMDYLKQQKADGRIRHLGLSAHGSHAVMQRFLAVYGEDIEFCQIQLNFLDWSFQGAKDKAKLLADYHIPVWVMEPLRGGKLSALPQEYETKLRQLRPEESIPAWSFRFIQSIPGVVVTLSGMSSFEQLRENIHTFESEAPLNEQELNTLLNIAESMVSKIALPCTACRYCTDHCPQGLDIPSLLELYNEHVFSEGGFIAPMALAAVPLEQQPGACTGCKSCEAVCPQQIIISEAMADFVEKLQA